MMQVLSKVIRLDLQYSSQQSHLYQRQTCYLAPFYHEEALHFAKRILAYLSLFELQPELAKQDPLGKQPDLFLRDFDQHFRLWCQVDLPNDKQLLRASHQSDQVLLVPDSADFHRAQLMIKGLSNVRLFELTSEQLNEFCSMLKGHMQLSIWREDNVLIITDGQQQLELLVACLATEPNHTLYQRPSTFTSKH
ncbi:MAG: YaeQ family protein [Gammaproteobacteria bacterium]|nr:YaeQ family protein [Gammaproteobacteria bacterium]